MMNQMKILECKNDCAYTKCADNLQCIKRESICDGKFDCKDRSDELCNAECLALPLKLEEKDIVRKCLEDSRVCLSVKQYCDGIGHCPDASDETQAGCTCGDWGLTSCVSGKHNEQIHCLNVNWSTRDECNQSALEFLDFLHSVKTRVETGNDTGLYHCYYHVHRRGSFQVLKRRTIPPPKKKGLKWCHF